MTSKRPIDIDEMLARIREAIEPFPKAALFELAAEGYASPFEQLVACILSIRTRDEVMLPAAKALFQHARSASAVSRMTAEEIDVLISTCTFHERKAAQIRTIARTIADEHSGGLPCDREVLLGFKGVGPKCANLVLGIACGEPHIGVDIHVHRVTNRWGYVEAPNPKATMSALESVLPKEYWVEINELLVPFGKHICTGAKPHCSTCPVLSMCRQVGVTTHR